MTRVKEIMTSGTVTVATDATCHDAVRSMVRHKIRHLPVVDSGGLLCGIVTDRDLRHQLFTPDVFQKVGTVPVEHLLSVRHVREVMSSPVVSIGPEAELSEAAQIMAEAMLGSLPVVDRGRIIGIVIVDIRA